MSDKLKPNKTDQMLTVEQMAAIQHCCTETIRNYLRAGLIRGAQRRGRRWLVPKPSYEKYLNYPPGTLVVPELPTTPTPSC